MFVLITWIIESIYFQTQTFTVTFLHPSSFGVSVCAPFASAMGFYKVPKLKQNKRV